LDPYDKDKGRWRQYQVVVVEGKKVTHVPPLPDKISILMRNLFLDIKRNRELSWIIKSCICHYGIQYIHPFTDGNGRMGRIWQHLLLLKMNPIFQYILIGNLIKNNATAYYHSLDKSDLKKNGAFFIEFCLIKIQNDLRKLEELIK
jgi:Fic family protein